MTGEETLARLDAVGVSVGASPEQRRLLAALSEQEVDVLTSIKQRMDAVEPDVRGHANDVGWTFW
jgi:hypothetical protein